MQFLREALDPADGVLKQNLERRTAPVGESIALEVIVTGERNQLHRIAEILIPAQLEPPETVILGERTVETEPRADIGRAPRFGRPVGLTCLGGEIIRQICGEARCVEEARVARSCRRVGRGRESDPLARDGVRLVAPIGH